jgi:glycosyltransferase involved in cell wall biosynthesis
MSDIIWAMARRLARWGDDVHVVAPYPASLAPSPDVTVHQQRILPPAYRNIIGHLLLAATAWAKLRAIPAVQVVHAAEYTSTAVICRLGSSCPVVLTTPGNIYERIENVNHFDPTVTTVYKTAARVSAKSSAKIIATSQEMQTWWEYSGAAPSRIIQIPLGVDTRVFRPTPEARALLGLGTSPNVLFVGRLQSENGVEYLLQAMSSVVKQVKEAMLDIVGDGPDLKTLVDLSQALGLTGRVRWHGRVALKQLPLFYSAADVFALPRLSRVTPRVLFEAMACQKPIVTSAIGGIVDFVEDRKTGFLVNPRDPETLAERIEQSLVDRELALRMGRAASKYAYQNLDWDIVVRRIRTEVYDQLVQ